MDKNFELKDSLYYSDLMYEIKKLARLEYVYDIETELRLRKRKEDIVTKTRNGDTIRLRFELSPFQEDIFRIAKDIIKKDNDSFNIVYDIYMYPEQVNKYLDILNKENDDNMIVSYLVSIIQESNLNHAFSLGEDCEQHVCLNKKEGLWEVYMIERGTVFEKDIFEDCYDACLQVIHHLADSKQWFEQTKKQFALKRKK